MKNEATIDGITVGGQPSADELANGRFAHVVNVRRHEEQGNDTAQMLAGSETGYTAVPYTIDTLTADHIRQIREALEGVEGGVLIH